MSNPARVLAPVAKALSAPTLRTALRLLAPALVLVAAAFVYHPATGYAWIDSGFPYIVGSFTIAMSAIFAAASKLLGKPTAWAFLTLVMAGAFALVFGIIGGCGTSGSCTPRQTLDWAMTGAAFPVFLLMFFAVPAQLVKLYLRGGLWAWNRTGLPMPTALRNRATGDTADQTTAGGPADEPSRARARKRSGNPAVRNNAGE